MTALECLVDFVNVEGSCQDLNHLLDLIENDPVPFIRHKLIRLLVDNPPFPKAKHHANDREELVQRLWHLMNSGFWYDSRLRCDVVDLYAKLYGRGKPACVSILGDSAVKHQQPSYMVETSKKSEKGKSEAYKIPKKSDKLKDQPSTSVQSQQPSAAHNPGTSSGLTKGPSPVRGNLRTFDNVLLYEAILIMPGRLRRLY